MSTLYLYVICFRQCEISPNGDLVGTVWDHQMGNCLTCFKEPTQTAQDESSPNFHKEGKLFLIYIDLKSF